MSTDSQPPTAEAPSQPTDEDDDADDNPYVIGEPHPLRQDHATLETKPSVPEYTGGGYEHWRSTELRPHTPGDSPEDVYVSHHRLLAVVACYDIEKPLDEVLANLAEKDVHHRNGIPFDNRPSNLETRRHGEHAAITQTQRRAWAEDRKRDVQEASEQPLTWDECDRCGREAEDLAECEAWPDETRCIECATETADGHEILL